MKTVLKVVRHRGNLIHIVRKQNGAIQGEVYNGLGFYVLPITWGKDLRKIIDHLIDEAYREEFNATVTAEG